MKKYWLLPALLVTFPVAAQELVIEEIPFEPIKTEQEKEIVALKTSDGTLDDLYTLLDEQKTAIQNLTERLEQTEHQLKQTEEKLERVNQDLAFRLTELENKPIPEPVVIDKTSDKDRYDLAYDLLQKKDYKNAEQQFLAFLKDFEKSDLTPNALYWLGETYYVQGMYEQAVGKFADVFAKHPKSTKAPDALLKMGLAMLSLNKKTEACTAFIALPNEYPKASAALKTKANEETKKNKCS